MILHYEDFHEGQVFDLGRYHISADEIIAFAREFDPQDFHLSEEAGKSSVLGGLAASGWQVCALVVRMATDAYINGSAAMGSNGIDEVMWLKPVYAGETLTGTMTVLSKRVSSKRPEMGILKCHWELFNLKGQKKTDMIGVNFMRVRQP